MNFNLVGNLAFQLNQSAARQTRSQAEAMFTGIKGKIDLELSPQAEARIKSLSTNVSALQASLRGLDTASTQAANAINRVSGAMSGAASRAQSVSTHMAGAASNTRAAGLAAQQAGYDFQEFGKQVALAGRRFVAFTVAAGAMFTVARAFREGISEAINFDLQLNKLRQVSGDTAEEVGKVGAEVMRLATTMGASSSELLEAANTLKQAGLATKDVKTALEGIAQASLAPNFSDMKQITEGAVAGYQQFGKEIKNVKEQLGAMNAVAGEFAVEASDLVTAVQKAGGVAAQTGTSFNELIALITSVRSTTRESSESISTGFRTIFTRLQSKDTVEGLRQLGINLRYTRDQAAALGDVGLEDQFVGGYEAVRRLSEGLSKLRTTDPRFAAAIEQLGGYRQVSRVIPLISQFTETQKALNVAQLGSASLESAAATRQDALATKFAKTREAFQAFVNSLVQSKGFKTTVDGLLDVAGALIKVLDVLKPTIPLLTTLATIKVAQGAVSFGRGMVEAFSGPTGGTSRVPPRLRFATGGVVPGVGSGDSVRADLEPGEFVVRKDSAQRIGYDTLHGLNSGRRRFAAGGDVKPKQWIVGQGNVTNPLTETSEQLPLHEFLKRLPADPRTPWGGRADDVKIQQVLMRGRPGPSGRATFEPPTLWGRLKGRLLGRFADGGQVPALLTPGEFVFSKDAAARLGPNALKKMNETGELPRFAKGGFVMKLAGGTGDFDAMFANIHGDLQKKLKQVLSRSNIDGIEVDDLMGEAFIGAKSAFGTGYGMTEGWLLDAGVKAGRNYLRREERNRNKTVATGFDPADRRGQGVPVSHRVHRGPQSREETAYHEREEAVLRDLIESGLKPGTAEFEVAYAESMGPGNAGTSPSTPAPTPRGKKSRATAGASQAALVSLPTSVPASPTTSLALAGAGPTALAKTNGGRYSAFPQGSEGNDIPDAEYSVVRPPLMLPPGRPTPALPGAPKMLPAGPSLYTMLPTEGTVLPSSVGPPWYGVMEGPANPVPQLKTKLPRGYGLADVDDPAHGPVNPFAPLPSGGMHPRQRQAADYSRAERDLAQATRAYEKRRPDETIDDYSARLMTGTDAPTLQTYRPSRPPGAAERLRNSRESAWRDAVAAEQIDHYNGRSSVSRKDVAGRDFAAAGLQTANFGDLANLRISGALSAAGGPGMLSAQTMTEVANKEHSKAEQELTRGIQRQLQALTPAISATEARRKAEEMAATALQEGSAVLRNKSGSVVGLHSLGEQLAVGGQNVSGRGRFSDFLATRSGAVGRGLSWAGSRMGGGVGGLVALSAAPMIGGQFDPSKDQIEAAAVTGNTGGIRRGAAVGGALSGAAVGAGVGMMLGPWGAVIGGVIGGLSGLATSLSQAEKDIREAKVGNALTKLGETLQGAGGSAGLNANELKTQLDAIQAEVHAKVKDATSSFWGTSTAAETVAIRTKLTREAFGSQAGAMVNVLTRQSQDVAKRSPDGDAATLSRELNADLLKQVADLRQVPLAQVLREFTESIQVSQRQLRAQTDSEKGRDAAERTATGLIRMADAISNATTSVGRFESALSVSGNLFTGQNAGVGFKGFANGFSQLGTGTGVEYTRSAAILQGYLGEAGKTTLRTAQAADQVSRVMPGVLNAIGKDALGPDDNLKKRSRDLLMANLLPDVAAGERDRALDARPELRRVIETVTSELSRVSDESKDKGGLSKRLGENPDKVLDEVLSSTKDTSQRLAEMARAIEDNANRMVEGVAQSHQQAAAIGEAWDNVAGLRLGRFRASAEVQADRTGRTVGDILSLRDLQAPFQSRQERLTGFVGDEANDPSAIAAKLGQVRTQIDSVLTDRAKITSKNEFDESAKKLGALTGQANNLQVALRNLANAGERAAGIQEKLSDLNTNRNGRLGYAEKFVMAGPEQQTRMRRGQDVLAGVDRGKLKFNTLSPEEQKLFIETANDFGPVRLASGRTGAGLKEQILGGLPGVLDPKQEADRANLQDKVVDVAKVAESAGQALASVLKDENGRFLTGLRSLQEQFFARLATNAASEALGTARADEARASGRRGELNREERQSKLLSGIGIRDNMGLEAARNSKGDIDKYLSLTEKIRGVYSKPIASDLGSAIAAGTTGSGHLEDKLRTVLTSRGLETLSPEQQTETLRRIVEDYTTLPLGEVNHENLTKISRRELVSGRARTAADYEQERNESRGKLVGAGINLTALQGLGDGGKKALDEALRKDNPLNPDTLGERIKKSEDDLAKFSTAVREAEKRLNNLSAREGAGALQVETRAAGGPVFKGVGTDTVPAMLSPGEFIVNARSAAANASLLASINGSGGTAYLAEGGFAGLPGRPYGPPETADPGRPRDYWGVATPQPSYTDRVVGAGPYAVTPSAPPPDASGPRYWDVHPDSQSRIPSPGKYAPILSPQPPRDTRPFAVAGPGDAPVNPMAPPSGEPGKRYGTVHPDGQSVVPTPGAGKYAPVAGGLPKDTRPFAIVGGGNFPTNPMAPPTVPTGGPGDPDAQRRSNLQRMSDEWDRKTGKTGAANREAAATPPWALLNAHAQAKAPSLAYQQAIVRGTMMPGEEFQANAASLVVAQRRWLDHKSFLDRHGRETLAARIARSQDGRTMAAHEKRTSYYDAQRKRWEEGLAKERARTLSNPNLGRNAAFGTNTVITPGGSWRGGAPMGFATGGIVPGSGGGDNFPAMLTPGEVVLNRSAVNGLGGPNRANALNAGGGPGASGQLNLDQEARTAIESFGRAGKDLSAALNGFTSGATNLMQAVGTFNSSVEKLAGVLENFKGEVSLTGSFTTEVVINGAEAFAGMEDKFKQTMESYVTAKVAEEFQVRLPDGPPRVKSDPSRVA